VGKRCRITRETGPRSFDKGGCRGVSRLCNQHYKDDSETSCYSTENRLYCPITSLKPTPSVEGLPWTRQFYRTRSKRISHLRQPPLNSIRASAQPSGYAQHFFTVYPSVVEITDVQEELQSKYLKKPSKLAPDELENYAHRYEISSPQIHPHIILRLDHRRDRAYQRTRQTSRLLLF
jgi:hypothetical protein